MSEILRNILFVVIWLFGVLSLLKLERRMTESIFKESKCGCKYGGTHFCSNDHQKMGTGENFHLFWVFWPITVPLLLSVYCGITFVPPIFWFFWGKITRVFWFVFDTIPDKMSLLLFFLVEKLDGISSKASGEK